MKASLIGPAVWAGVSSVEGIEMQHMCSFVVSLYDAVYVVMCGFLVCAIRSRLNVGEDLQLAADQLMTCHMYPGLVLKIETCLASE